MASIALVASLLAGGGWSAAAQDGGSSRKTAENAVPKLRSTSPAYVSAGAGAVQVNIHGEGFADNATARWGGQNRPTRVVNRGLIRMDLSAADLASARNVSITVFNPTPAGGLSNAVTFEVRGVAPVQPPSNEPTPSITAVEPATLTAGTGDVVLRIRGQGFTSASRIRFNGQVIDPGTLDITATEIATYLGGGYFAQPGTIGVTVANTYPSGTVRVSNAVSVPVVLPPPPAITSLDPATIVVGTNTGLRIRGQNFRSDSEVRLDGSVMQNANFVSSTEIAVFLGGGYFDQPKTMTVVVANKGPTGIVQASAPATIQVVASAPR